MNPPVAVGSYPASKPIAAIVHVANVEQADVDDDGLGDASDKCPADNSNDVDDDGVTSADTDGVILQAYLANASPSDVLPLISATSPIETADDLLIQLLDIA